MLLVPNGEEILSNANVVVRGQVKSENSSVASGCRPRLKNACLSSLIYSAFKYDASRMLMSKNVNNNVSKDRSVKYPPSARRRELNAVLEEK